MVYITGDIHGDPMGILRFAKKFKPKANDLIVILGDAGLNYYNDDRDKIAKQYLQEVGCKFLCIHGNHEMRPDKCEGYVIVDFKGGKTYAQYEYDNIHFAIDGEIYLLDGKRCMAIGGAYSVDKQYRLARGAGWWEDEQPSPEIKARVESKLASNPIDVIFSHTCPFKLEPRETFLSFIDQNTVDTSTEEWLDTIEDKYSYEAWYCGHWHIDKRIDKMHFLFHGFETLIPYEKLKMRG